MPVRYRVNEHRMASDFSISMRGLELRQGLSVMPESLVTNKKTTCSDKLHGSKRGSRKPKLSQTSEAALTSREKGFVPYWNEACQEQLTVVVAHADRLARFGFELISWILERNGGKIVVLGRSAKGSPTEELTQDLLAVLFVFAARLHGLRSYRDKIKEDKTLSDTGAGGADAAVDGGQPLVLQPDN